MRKAILINSLVLGGAEIVAMNIASYLKNKGDNTVLLLFTRLKEQYDPKGLDVHYFLDYQDLDRGISINKIISFFRLQIMLIRYIKKNEIELVQSHLFMASIMNVIAKIFGCKHSIQIVNHMLVSYERTEGLIGKLKLSLLKFAYNKADLIISISKKMKSDIDESVLKNKSTKHVVISNPHDVESIVDKMNDEVSEFNFNNEHKYIVTFGRLAKRKKLDVLLKAFSALKTQNSHIELLVLGDGEEADSLKELTESLGISDSVHFLGYIENPFKYLKYSHLFVLSSESEGLPNAVIEAMICKIPVISTDCPTGPREILAPETDFLYENKNEIEITQYGTLVPYDNIELLSKAMKMVLIDDYDTFKSKSNDAFEYVKKYHINTIMNKYMEVILQDDKNKLLS